MKTPTWAIVIGVCLMLFGGCSVSTDLQDINLPEVLETQKNVFGKLTDSTLWNATDSLGGMSPQDSAQLQTIKVFQQLAEGMDEMYTVSEFTLTWTVRFGYIGLLISTIYILSGVFLLLKKPFSIPLVYIALTASMVVTLAQYVVLSSDSSGGILAAVTGTGQLFGIIIDLVLLMVVITVDKSAYNQVASQKASPTE